MLMYMDVRLQCGDAVEYVFTGRDEVAQLYVFIISVHALFFVPAGLDVLGVVGLAVLLACVGGGALGLRCRIVMRPAGVAVTRLWWFVPYWRHRTGTIKDVWYGGNWGLEDEAIGVVIKFDNGREVHVGARATMRALHAALTPYAGGSSVPRAVARPPRGRASRGASRG